MPNQCTCRLIFLGNVISSPKFEKEFDKLKFSEHISKRMTNDNKYITIDFTYPTEPPIEEIKNVYSRLEQENHFHFKSTLIYYEIEIGFYGVYKHTTNFRTKNDRYTIQGYELYCIDKHHEICEENEDGEYNVGNEPFMTIANAKFAKLLLKYDMDNVVD